MDYDSGRRHRNGGGKYRHHSRSRTRSRSRERSREHNNHHHRSRDRERDRERDRDRDRDRPYRGVRNNINNDNDLYRDIINEDFQEEKNYNSRNRANDDEQDSRERYYMERARERNRDYDRDYDKDRKDRNGNSGRNYRFNSPEDDSDEEDFQNHNFNQTPSPTIVVFRLQWYITEADINSVLIRQNITSARVRLIRTRETGASRGFAFVEFNTVGEAAHWMELNQGLLILGDTIAELEYSHTMRTNATSDWICAKCKINNFKRREKCFRCSASRDEFGFGGEAASRVSNILTKKIMLRNLDALTNEEGVLTAIQQVAPDLSKKITKILISRDPLTQTSLGICYMNFETLVDSMNLHNTLVGLEPPFSIDGREVWIYYCIDQENRQIFPGKSGSVEGAAASSSGASTSGAENSVPTNYTLSDVPRLAEYSASLYATTPEEHAHYFKYYTEYYISEINKDQQSNLPTPSQLTEANSAAAVALSAIQRKQKKMNAIETTATQAAQAAAAAAAAVKASMAAAQLAQPVVTPKGNDGKVYPTPDVSLYQYDETSGYYYDPTTGLYYDAHSQYYYNNETGAYLYWDQGKSTYVLATPAAAAAAVKDAVKGTVNEGSNAATTTNNAEDESKKDKDSKNNNQDKVKVAKKIVKDMEKWAKQLNQKKDYTAVATPQPILTTKGDNFVDGLAAKASNANSYADVGFSILEKKDRSKMPEFMSPNSNSNSNTVSGNSKLVTVYGGSDSDDEHSRLSSGTMTKGVNSAVGEANEKEYVDFQKLTCLLCKRAFQSAEILQKHLKMSNLHKENLQKHNLARGLKELSNDPTPAASTSLSYRDRAKERRLKYGESDPPPPNRTRECFEKEIKYLTSKGASTEQPASLPLSGNVGSRLLQKMGWSEGQGLGRQNQGRTNIVEADGRYSKAGLGNTAAGMGPNDDYKTYIKKMMKTRYESV